MEATENKAEDLLEASAGMGVTEWYFPPGTCPKQQLTTKREAILVFLLL